VDGSAAPGVAGLGIVHEESGENVDGEGDDFCAELEAELEEVDGDDADLEVEEDTLPEGMSAPVTQDENDF
jgi:hypothetical protein